MSTLINKYDALESLIFESGLRIAVIEFKPEQDLFLVTLNTKVVLPQRISLYKRFQNASLEQLQSYELIGAGTGIHWPLLDEDLSLKGFLSLFLKDFLHGNTYNAMAA